MDYDALANSYSHHRVTHPGILQNIIETSGLNPTQTVLEVGCGTGNYILALQAAAGCRGWGIDPSIRMLDFARQRSCFVKKKKRNIKDLGSPLTKPKVTEHASSVTFEPGGADSLPFEDGLFNLVFSVDVIHHLDNPAAYFKEAHRVLKPGGLICTVTENEALLSSRIPLAKYFPETVEKELERYPRIQQLHQFMENISLLVRKEYIVRQPYELKNLDPFEEKAFSALHAISEDAFQRGLDRMRIDLESGPIQAVSHYLLLWGTKTNP